MECSNVTRYLRIAVTALSLTACVLLVALWVRSNRWADDVWIPLPLNRDIGLTSESGCVSISLFRRDMTPPYPFGWSSSDMNRTRNPVPPTNSGFRVVREPDYSLIYVPNWFLALLAAVFAAVPWVNRIRRYSLRTLLIVTTLVAVGLGTVIYIAR
jgi:hypothetical protein